jgi:hypothetical protein
LVLLNAVFQLIGALLVEADPALRRLDLSAHLLRGLAQLPNGSLHGVVGFPGLCSFSFRALELLMRLMQAQHE